MSRKYPATPRIAMINECADLLPKKATEGSIGYDLKAKEAGMLLPGDRLLLRTGTRVALPLGDEAQIRPRSGLAIKHGVTVLNSPGTIDADFRGEVQVILINHGRILWAFNRGDKIAQIVFTGGPAIVVTEEEIDTYTTNRGAGGFGSTG